MNTSRIFIPTSTMVTKAIGNITQAIGNDMSMDGTGGGGVPGRGIPPFLLSCETLPPITPEVIDRVQREVIDGELSSMAEVTKMIWNVVPMVLFVVGMLGNILTVVIIVRQKRMTSTTVFLLLLAFSDMMLLCNAPLRQWIRYTYTETDEKTGEERPKNWRVWTEHGCRASLFLTYSSLHLSSWILVAVTMERVVSVVLPHKIKVGSTIKSSVCVVVVLAVVIFGFNAHFIYGFGKSDLPEFDGIGYCEAKYANYKTFSDKYWPWLDFAVTFGIPFGFLVAGNGIIIWKLRRTQLNRRQMSVVQSASNKTFEKDAKVLTLTLVLLAVVFFICLTPIQIFLIYIPYRNEEVNELKCKDLIEWRDQIEISNLWNAITNCFGYINASFNFVLYVISGSKFRQEIKSLFLCRTPGRDSVFGSSSNDNSRKIRRAGTGTTEVNSSIKSQL